ncbi:MAG: prepilin-type N-terminal cleavage/methylation domain-containing protein [Candidatus Sulfotelmatobacter sp.]|jgi:prepilin-type N-terminal cleavage/methylation domain-containing protein
MKTNIRKSQRGFSLLELMIASVIGVLVMAAMTSLFRQAMTALFTVSQRAETQENMRAAIELMTKDIGSAGAGLPSGGLQLANKNGVSNIACNQNATCYLIADVYPDSGTGALNYMYGILPGFAKGVENGAVITNAPGATNDSITSIYCDYNFPLTNFTFAFPSAVQANVTVVNGGVTPNNILAPGGLNVGDLLLFIVSTPGNGAGNQGNAVGQTAAAVGEITGIPNNGQIEFAAADPLNFNQTGANSLAALAAADVAGTTLSACRLYAVTYFLEVPAAGGTVQVPRLMRQVNGLKAIPVADNIINLQFSYDVINSATGTINANVANPIAAGLSPALIQKVNIWVLGESIYTDKTRSQSMYLATSVSARNMSFCNSYSFSSTACQ